MKIIIEQAIAWPSPRNDRMRVLCPFCGYIHLHGYERDACRVPHCVTGPRPERAEYHITLLDGRMPADIRDLGNRARVAWNAAWRGKSEVIRREAITDGVLCAAEARGYIREALETGHIRPKTSAERAEMALEMI